MQATTVLSLGKHLVPYQEQFSKPLFKTFAAFLESLIAASDSTLGTVGMLAGKSLSSIAYFLNEGAWNQRALNTVRKDILANHPEAKPHADDIACLDGSAIVKRGNHFEVLAKVHDGRDGLIKNGYSFFGFSIVNSERKIRYLLDFLFVSTVSDNFRSIWKSWMRLVGRNLSRIKARLFVLDAGFRNRYFLRFLRNSGKHFVVRMLATMVLWIGKERMSLEEIQMRIESVRVHIQNVGTVTFWCERGVVNAWKKEIPEETTILVIKRSGFRNPLILAASQALIDTAAMVRCYVAYLKRWSLECIFRELKQGLGLEKFQVRSQKAIVRYLTLVVIAHTVLFLKLLALQHTPEIQPLLVAILTKLRKLTDFWIFGLKKLYVICGFIHFRLPRRLSLSYQLNRQRYA